MELQDFVKLDPKTIRKDNELMRLFVDYYKAAFSVTPSCVGCVFKSGFKKLKKYAENRNKNINFETMATKEEKNFRLNAKYRLKILSYSKDGVVRRSYGYNMTNAFAEELAGFSPDVFDKLPAKEEQVVEEESAYSDLDYRSELLPLYTEVKERVGKEAESNKKDDIIKFLEENND